MNLDGLTQRLRDRFLGRKEKSEELEPTNRRALRAIGIQGAKHVVDRFADGQVFGQRRGSFLGPMARPRLYLSHASAPGWRERFIRKVFSHKGTRAKRTEQRLRAQQQD